MAVEKEYARLDTAHIYYEVTGDGPPLILIHGLAGSSRWWKRNMGALADQFRVYVVDLIGFGNSRAQDTFVLSEAAHVLATWMEELQIDSAHVIGHSMGGVISIDLAIQYPGKVKRLVLVNAAVFSFEETLPGNFLRLVKTVWYLPFSFLPILFTDAYRSGPLTLWRASKELITTDMTTALSHLETSTLVIWGNDDALVPLPLGERLCTLLSNGRLDVIEGAGHTPMWDQPQRFNQAVLHFLTNGCS